MRSTPKVGFVKPVLAILGTAFLVAACAGEAHYRGHARGAHVVVDDDDRHRAHRKHYRRHGRRHHRRHHRGHNRRHHGDDRYDDDRYDDD